MTSPPKSNRVFSPVFLALLTFGGSVHAQHGDQALFESERVRVAGSRVDTLVMRKLRARGIEPARLSSDQVFVRRVYLDVIGTLPEPAEVEAFNRDQSPKKRAALIDALLTREEFADYWSLKWGDLLRMKAEFPINLWPNGVQAYHRWIRDALRSNMPYDRFARALLTSSGSNFRVPPVNFYRAVQSQQPDAVASAAALTFMGTRFEKWPEARRLGMQAFFSRLEYKNTAEWKEQIVQFDPASAGTLQALFPDGTKVRIAPDRDPRAVFADWLVSPGNPWFARNIANRIWAWLMGRGIIHEPDDIRPDNLPANPELLAYLEKELIRSRYDLRHIYRLILNSRTYQQSSIPRSDHKDAHALFAYYPVRRLSAEVLVDALCQLSGTTESYSSPIPEPFAFIPENQRTIALADGSITSPFLELFGRPSRDTGLESERNNQPTDAQRLHLLNSTHIQRKIETGVRLRELFKNTRDRPAERLRSMYLMILSREPTPAEATAATTYFRTAGLNPRQAATDLAWALINTKEFLFHH